MNNSGIFLIIASIIVPFLCAGMVFFAKSQQGADFKDMIVNTIGCFLVVALVAGAGVYLIFAITQIPPTGPKPEGGCSAIEKLWAENGSYYVAVRYPSGNVKSLRIDRDDYGALKVGGWAEVDWSTVEVSTLTRDGAIWAFEIKPGCAEPSGK